jgi:cupin fold WbuC family metalloprotein
MTKNNTNDKAVEPVKYKGEEIAIIVRYGYKADGANFFTKDDNPLQVGLIQYAPGHMITPHKHLYRPETITEMQEVIYIVRGKARLTMYDSDTEAVIMQTDLVAGDFLLQKQQAHGFEYLEETVIFEVKQGPYQGLQDAKLYLETNKNDVRRWRSKFS